MNAINRPVAGVTFVVELCSNDVNVYKIKAFEPKTNTTGMGASWQVVGEPTIHYYTCQTHDSGDGRYSCGVFVQQHFEARVGIGPVNQKVSSWSPWIELYGYYEGTAHCRTWSQNFWHQC